MWWMAGNPGTDRSDRSELGWLERKIARRPFRAVIICCIIATVLLTTGFLVRIPFLFFIGAFLVILSILLFFYALVRLAMDTTEKKRSKATYTQYESTETDHLSRRETVSRWKERARQEEQDRIIEDIKRRR